MKKQKGVTEMTNEEIALKLQETTDRSLRNEGRVKKLEGEHEALQQLATSVAVMAEQMQQVNTTVKTLDRKVDELEGKPAKRWEAVIAAAVTAIVAALIGFALARVGLG